MRTTIVALLVVAGLSGFATAAEDESAFKLDLTGTGASKDAGVYYLKCQYGRDISNGCGRISVWEEANDVLYLQTKGGMDGSPIDKSVIS